MIEFQKNNASLSFSEALLKGKDGEDGGYYKPSINNNLISWQPSKTDMPPVDDFALALGGGASDFIIKMTVTSDDNGNYTVASCDTTVEQIDAAVSAEKRAVVIASVNGTILELPMLQEAQGVMYAFGMFMNGQMTTSFVQKIDGGTSEWQFLMTQIEALSVSYSNDALPNVNNVGGALNALVPKSHNHNNRLALDKLSTDNANSTNLYVNGRANQIAFEPKIYNYASYTSTTLNLTNNCYYILRQVHKLTINPPSTPTVAANTIWITFADEGDIELAFPTTVKYIGKIPTVKNGETWEVTIINKVVSIQKVGEGA